MAYNETYMKILLFLQCKPEIFKNTVILQIPSDFVSVDVGVTYY